MNSHHTLRVVLWIMLVAPLICSAQSSPASKEPAKTMHAKGAFDVKVSPLASPELPQGVIGRMLIDKQFHGDLEAASTGEMLAAGSGAKGSSGGYVALEQVTGSLNGRKGAFVLQHSATMSRGVPQLSIQVVPDSGTGDLAGISGTMNIIMSEGKHSYDFEYSLPDHK